MKVPIRKRQKTIIPSFIIFLLLLLLSNFSKAGFQEEKLFDGDFYSVEDLRKKIELHNRDIKVLIDQIKSLEMDVDWLVLKINQIEDSGRVASSNLKNSIKSKEEKIQHLNKTKARLEYLVQYYNTMLESSKKEEFNDIFMKKVPHFKDEKMSRIQTKSESSTILQPSIAPTEVSPMTTQDQDLYDGVSKVELENAVKNAGLVDWVQIIGTGSCLRIETTMPILFPTGSAKLAGEYKSFFKQLADFLKPYDVKILVTGYADKVPIHNKKYPSNFELGATRAANIVHQFVNYGLKPSIFRIESTGKHRFASKQMSKQKSLERRAEVTVIFSG